MGGEEVQESEMKEIKLRLEEQHGGIPTRVIIDEEQAQNEKATLDKMVCEEKMKLIRERAVRIARQYLYGPLDERLEEAYQELIKIAKGMNQSKIKGYMQTIQEAYRQASEQREVDKRARLAMALDDLFHAGGNGEAVIQALDDYLDARGTLTANLVEMMLPTPTANRRDGLQSHGVNVVSGSLNPVFVEWLMGYPLGWTALNASEIALSLKSRKRFFHNPHSTNGGMNESKLL